MANVGVTLPKVATFHGGPWASRSHASTLHLSRKAAIYRKACIILPVCSVDYKPSLDQTILCTFQLASWVKLNFVLGAHFVAHAEYGNSPAHLLCSFRLSPHAYVATRVLRASGQPFVPVPAVPAEVPILNSWRFECLKDCICYICNQGILLHPLQQHAPAIHASCVLLSGQSIAELI